jgi:hypothetical protein
VSNRENGQKAESINGISLSRGKVSARWIVWIEKEKSAGKIKQVIEVAALSRCFRLLRARP